HTSPYTLSLHDALPICIPKPHAVQTEIEDGAAEVWRGAIVVHLETIRWLELHRDTAIHRRFGAGLIALTVEGAGNAVVVVEAELDRKSTRLNSSHVSIS